MAYEEIVTTSDSRLTDARPASDVYPWAKDAYKPKYTAPEIGGSMVSHLMSYGFDSYISINIKGDPNSTARTPIQFVFSTQYDNISPITINATLFQNSGALSKNVTMDGVTGGNVLRIWDQSNKDNTHTYTFKFDWLLSLWGSFEIRYSQSLINPNIFTVVDGSIAGESGATELNIISSATSDHSHGLSHTDLFTYIDSTNEWMSMNNIPYMANVLKAFRTQQNAPSWAINNFSAGIAFGGADTKGIISQRYDYPEIKFAGGSGDVANWTLSIAGSSGQVYDLNRVPNIMTRGLNPDGFSYQLANDGGIYNIKVMAYGSTDEYNAYIVNNILYIVRVGNGGWEGLFSGGISTSGDVLNFGFKDWTSYVVTKFVNWNA